MKKISKNLVLGLTLGVLAFCCTGLSAQETMVKDNIFKILDWNGYDQTTELSDGSSLYSYVAESNRPVLADDTSENELDVDQTQKNLILRFTFLPRFKCSPLIELIGTMPKEMSSDSHVTTLKSFNKLSVAIDEEEFDFPVEVEQKNSAVHSFMSASLARRASLKILVELGDAVAVTFGDGAVSTLSLLGSSNTVNQAQGRCRNHQ